MHKKLLVGLLAITMALAALLGITACNQTGCGCGKDCVCKDTDQSHVHVLIHHDRVEPTCTKEGNIEYWSCGGCGKIFTGEAGANETTQISIPMIATGHDMVFHEREEPTCTETGREEY